MELQSDDITTDLKRLVFASITLGQVHRPAWQIKCLAVPVEDRNTRRQPKNIFARDHCLQRKPADLRVTAGVYLGTKRTGD